MNTSNLTPNIKQLSEKEIRLSDFDKQLTQEELQKALKQIIILHNKLSEAVTDIAVTVDGLEKEARWNRPFTI